MRSRRMMRTCRGQYKHLVRPAQDARSDHVPTRYRDYRRDLQRAQLGAALLLQRSPLAQLPLAVQLPPALGHRRHRVHDWRHGAVCDVADPGVAGTRQEVARDRGRSVAGGRRASRGSAHRARNHSVVQTFWVPNQRCCVKTLNPVVVSGFSRTGARSDDVGWATGKAPNADLTDGGAKTGAKSPSRVRLKPDTTTDMRHGVREKRFVFDSLGFSYRRERTNSSPNNVCQRFWPRVRNARGPGYGSAASTRGRRHVKMPRRRHRRGRRRATVCGRADGARTA